MVDLSAKEKLKKKNNLRYCEYYNMQSRFDELYEQSKNKSNFKHLFRIITSDENILLAYRTIKTNKGSETAGTNGHTIKYWKDVSEAEFLTYTKNRLNQYKPQTIRRKWIPKPDGRKRPLGIPNIEDRIIQQCIKQVLEPICEAKFHPHSYGFRPNRSTEHAIAYLYKKINIDKCYYSVDIDIKGFFDNVNHKKLLKQLWTIGIHDRKLISIIAAMLKAPIKHEGISTKGVPQGGTLSPLLANIVLNELDWWISSQWETIKTRHEYSGNNTKYRALRKNTTLKEIYIVRYADDFKILCKKKEDARKIFQATKMWLKERLQLDINEEKSKITNVKKCYTEFLGFKIKVVKKKQKLVTKSHITEKAKKKISKNLKDQVKKIQKNPTPQEVLKLNAMIMGIQNYYCLATHVTIDMSKLHHQLKKIIQNRLKSELGKKGFKGETFKIRYKGYQYKDYNVAGITIFPLSAIKTKNPMNFKQEICNYTKTGREYVHQSLSTKYGEMLRYYMEHPNENRTLEYNDNRLSKYTAQRGKCPISGEELGINAEVHHIKPVSQGGTDEFQNLVIVTQNVHKLIHATEEETIQLYLKTLPLKPKEAIKKINKYRIKAKNYEIIM